MPELVLIVEDNDDLRELVAHVLRQEGYRTAEARNGAEALASVQAARPAAIVMDLSMPVMDGVTATRALRGATHTRHIPVIALTAVAGLPQAVCDLFYAVLVKPSEPEALLALVRKAIASS